MFFCFILLYETQLRAWALLQRAFSLTSARKFAPVQRPSALVTTHPLPLPATFLRRILFQLTLEILMATFGLIEYQDASPEVRAVYDDIMATRKIDWINNFWKAIAHDPALLKRTWESLKQVMGAGALDPLTKELIYIAVSVTNNCTYCIASHTASAFGEGITDAMFKELQAN